MKNVIAGFVLVAGISGLSLAAESNAPAATPAPAPTTWADSITLKGDFRYRYESINDDSKKDANKETYTRERARIRARLAAEAKVNDKIKATIGLSTGGNDPISGNQTLGDGGSKKEMRLDLAYLDFNALEKDATLGMWTDSDRWGGGTDGSGHKVYAKYQIMKNLQLGGSYFTDDKGISKGGTGYDRLQLDLLAAF